MLTGTPPIAAMAKAVEHDAPPGCWLLPVALFAFCGRRAWAWRGWHGRAQLLVGRLLASSPDLDTPAQRPRRWTPAARVPYRQGALAPPSCSPTSPLAGTAGPPGLTWRCWPWAWQRCVFFRRGAAPGAAGRGRAPCGGGSSARGAECAGGAGASSWLAPDPGWRPIGRGCPGCLRRALSTAAEALPCPPIPP